jgi:anti-sigma factor RsiW
VRDQLEAFVDGELSGADRLEVAQHIQWCPSCATMVEDLSIIGDTLRASAEALESPADDLGGLAAGVISRGRAEAALSWQGRIRRAGEDWHWLVVVSGAVAASLICFLALSALLAFGPEPGRRDSLATSLYMPPGVQVSLNTSLPADVQLAIAEKEVEDAAEVAAQKEAKEKETVVQLAMAVNNRGRRGRTDPTSRLIEEALLDEIVQLRLDEPLMLGRPAEESIAVSTVISGRTPERFLAQ